MPNPKPPTSVTTLQTTPNAIVPQWHPFATRLEEPNSTRKEAGNLRPMLAFEELPPHQLQTRKYTAKLEPGTVRYGVPSAAKVTETSAKVHCSTQIHNQLARLYPDVDAGSAHFFKKNRQTLMDLGWPTVFDPSTHLEIDGHPLVFIAAAPTIDPRWITIVVTDIAENLIKAASDSLKDAFHPHQILDFWTTEARYTLKANGKVQKNFFGSLYLLVELDMTHGARFGAHHPTDVAATFPGFIAHAGEKYKLLYAARLDHCMFCKNTNFNQHHTYKECTERLCKVVHYNA